MNMKKLFLLNLPYLLFVYPFDKLAQAFRQAALHWGRLHGSPFLPVAQFPSHGPADRHNRCGDPSHGGLPERQER